MLITCVMRNAWTHKLQWSGPTVHSSTVKTLNNVSSHRRELNNVVLPTLFNVFNNTEQFIVTPDCRLFRFNIVLYITGSPIHNGELEYQNGG